MIMSFSGFLASVCLLAFLLAVPGGARAQSEPTVALAEPGFKEVVRSGALIAGTVVVGTQAFGPPEGDDVVLRAHLPREWAGTRICLGVVTINGLYQASGTYLVPKDWPGGVAVLPFPTVHNDKLARLGGEELAFRITQNDCQAPASENVSVVLSNRRESDSITVLLNAFRAEAVYLYVGGQQTPILCTAIDNPSRAAFDTNCKIGLKDLTGKLPVEVFRIVDRKVAPPSRFAIWLPDG